MQAFAAFCPCRPAFAGAKPAPMNGADSWRDFGGGKNLRRLDLLCRPTSRKRCEKWGTPFSQFSSAVDIGVQKIIAELALGIVLL